MSGWEYLLILAVGAVIGVLGAMTGIGGGTLIVPFLTLGLGVPIHLAVASSIVSVIATSSAAAGVYLGNRLTNLRLGITLETCTAAGGILGGLAAVSLGGDTLTVVFAASLLLTALAMARRGEEARGPMPAGRDPGELGGHYYDPELRDEVHYGVQRLPLGLGLSVGAGLLSGLLGIGGGVVKVPAMVLAMNVPMKAAAATSNFMIGVTAVASAYIYYSHDFVEPVITSAVVIGVFLGSLVGARRAPHLESSLLTRLLALALALAALLMILQVTGVLR